MFHGINLCLFATNPHLKAGYIFAILTALVASIVMTSMVFGDYMDQQTASLMSIRQHRDLRFPNITLCPKYPDAINISLLLADIEDKLSITTELNNTDINNLMAFAMSGAGLDNFNPFIKKWNNDYINRLSIWFQKWKSTRSYPEFYSFIFETAGYKCEDFFAYCYYAGDELPCCEIFRFSYVMLRGRCLKLREFYQEDPALTGTLSVYMKYLPSNVILKGDNQPQAILYVSDEYPDVSTFPRFYLAPHKVNQLHLERITTSMLPYNPHCSNSSSALGMGTCVVNTWFNSRIVNPHNCTVFYLRNKYPNLPICPPEKIVRTYEHIVNPAFSNGTQCLPTCFRREIKLVMQETSIVNNEVTSIDDPIFQLEFAYDALQETLFEEVVTTTVPGFVAQIGGQFGLFLGISIFTIAHVVLLLILGLGYCLRSCSI